eukprot:augustus_masked-scaffold_5-processed-gene-14.9-mRNA-1 protein AED:1.00 eAED:1.00 QI:0/-1/0/0/-1/1/1/0/907
MSLLNLDNNNLKKTKSFSAKAVANTDHTRRKLANPMHKTSRLQQLNAESTHLKKSHFENNLHRESLGLGGKSLSRAASLHHLKHPANQEYQFLNNDSLADSFGFSSSRLSQEGSLSGLSQLEKNKVESLDDLRRDIARLSIDTNDPVFNPEHDFLSSRIAKSPNNNMQDRILSKSYSMRIPPGFSRHGSNQSLLSSLQYNKSPLGEKGRQVSFRKPKDPMSSTKTRLQVHGLNSDSKGGLKRFVSYAGFYDSKASDSNFLKDESDDEAEELEVSAFNEDDLLGLSGDKHKVQAEYVPIASRSAERSSRLPRVDSRQAMRKAFPKTVFDNVDVEIPSNNRPTVQQNEQQTAVPPLGVNRTPPPLSARNLQPGNFHSPESKAPDIGYGRGPLPHFEPQPEPMLYRSPSAEYGIPMDPDRSSYGFGFNSTAAHPPPNLGYAGFPRSQSPVSGFPSPGGGFDQIPYRRTNSSPVFDILEQQMQQQQQLQAQIMQQRYQNQMMVNLMMQQTALQTNLVNSLSGQRSTSNVFDKDLSDLLVRHKTTGYKPNLLELKGHIIEFSRDSHGSRLIQSLMETASQKSKEDVVSEVIPEALSLMQDLFGNYVMQNLFEHATNEQRNILASVIKSNMNVLSMQPHGCRVVQRAIDMLDSQHRNELLVEILDPSSKIILCAQDPHATHVLQKAVVLLQQELKKPQTSEDLKVENLKILSKIETAVAKEVLTLAVHPHACRLVQRILGDCDKSRSKNVAHMLGEILGEGRFNTLSIDQHGNFILQHLLDHGTQEQSAKVHDFVASRVLDLAQHKFGSHLVEKCFHTASGEQSSKLIDELMIPARNLTHIAASQIGQDYEGDVLLSLMKDPYANFVVQRAFDASQGTLRQEMTHEIQKRAEVLSRFTYGRHILAHVSRSEQN